MMRLDLEDQGLWPTCLGLGVLRMHQQLGLEVDTMDLCVSH